MFSVNSTKLHIFKKNGDAYLVAVTGNFILAAEENKLISFLSLCSHLYCFDKSWIKYYRNNNNFSQIHQNAHITDHKHKLQSSISIVWCNLAAKIRIVLMDGTKKQQYRRCKLVIIYAHNNIVIFVFIS